MWEGGRGGWGGWGEWEEGGRRAPRRRRRRGRRGERGWPEGEKGGGRHLDEEDGENGEKGGKDTSMACAISAFFWLSWASSLACTRSKLMRSFRRWSISARRSLFTTSDSLNRCSVCPTPPGRGGVSALLPLTGVSAGGATASAGMAEESSVGGSRRGSGWGGGCRVGVRPAALGSRASRASSSSWSLPRNSTTCTRRFCSGISPRLAPRRWCGSPP